MCPSVYLGLHRLYSSLSKQQQEDTVRSNKSKFAELDAQMDRRRALKRLELEIYMDQDQEAAEKENTELFTSAEEQLALKKEDDGRNHVSFADCLKTVMTEVKRVNRQSMSSMSAIVAEIEKNKDDEDQDKQMDTFNDFLTEVESTEKAKEGNRTYLEGVYKEFKVELAAKEKSLRILMTTKAVNAHASDRISFMSKLPEKQQLNAIQDMRRNVIKLIKILNQSDEPTADESSVKALQEEYNKLFSNDATPQNRNRSDSKSSMSSMLSMMTSNRQEEIQAAKDLDDDHPLKEFKMNRAK